MGAQQSAGDWKSVRQGSRESLPDEHSSASSNDLPPSGRRRLRGWLAAILVVLACIFALIAAVLFWSHGLLMNTDNFVGVVGPILKDPKVTRNVGDFVADKTIAVTDVAGRIRDVLPDEIKFLAAPLTSEVRDQVRKQMVKLLRSDNVYDLWIKINTFTHEEAIAMLRGQTKVMRIEGDKIILDLVPLVAIGIQELDKILPGVLGERIELPEIDVQATPDEQRAQLSQALGEPLSPTFGQVTLVQSAEVKTAQTAVKLFDIMIWVMLAVTLVLAAVAVAVSPRRLRTLIQLGLGAVVVTVLVTVVIGQLQGWLLGAVKVKGLVPFIDGAVGTIFASLRNALVWLLAVGAAIAVVAYVAGRPRWLLHSLSWLSRTVRAGATGAERARGPASIWVQGHLTGLQVGGLVVAIVILFFASSSLGWSIAIVALLAVYQIGLLLIDGRRPDWLPGGEPQVALAGAGAAAISAVAAAERPVAAPGAPPDAAGEQVSQPETAAKPEPKRRTPGKSVPGKRTPATSASAAGTKAKTPAAGTKAKKAAAGTKTNEPAAGTKPASRRTRKAAGPPSKEDAAGE